MFERLSETIPGRGRTLGYSGIELWRRPRKALPSGLNVTVESERGFPWAVLSASLGDAHRDCR